MEERVPREELTEAVDEATDAVEEAVAEAPRAASAAVERTTAVAEQVVAETARALEDAVDRLDGTPDGGRISRFAAHGMTLVAEEHSTGAPAFVLVHGIGMGRGVFGDLISHLVDHGRVVAVDLPGYGEADEPERIPTMERMADLVADFIRDRGIERPVLVGHSMGTQVVMEIAARHPDLAGPIVLVAPTVDATARRALTQLWRLGCDLIGESLKVLVLGGREYLRAGPNLRRKMKAMLVHRPEDACPRVRSRTLVMRGERDPVSPEPWCRRVAELIPDAEFVEIPGCGHETLIRDAAPAAERILAWLPARS